MNAAECREARHELGRFIDRAAQGKSFNVEQHCSIAASCALWEIAAQLAQMNAAKPAPQLADGDILFIESECEDAIDETTDKLTVLQRIHDRIIEIKSR